MTDTTAEIVVEEDNTETDESTTQTTEWTPPSKEEWERVLQAKDRYKTEAQKRRERIQALERGQAANPSGNDSEQNKDEKSIERAKLEGENLATTKYRGIIGRQAAKAALLGAGLKGKPDGLLKLIDMDDLEIDESGEVTGLEDQVDQLKSDYPELFTRGRTTTTRDKDGSDRRPPTGKPKSATDIALERAMTRRNSR